MPSLTDPLPRPSRMVSKKEKTSARWLQRWSLDNFLYRFLFFCFFFGRLGAGERLLIQSRLQAKERVRERAVHGQSRVEPRVADEALLLSLLGHSTQLDN